MMYSLKYPEVSECTQPGLFNVQILKSALRRKCLSMDMCVSCL